MSSIFKTDIAKNIFYQKYAISNNQTWEEKSFDIVEDVCGSMWGRRRKILSQPERDQLVKYISEMKFLPGGRYIYYAKRRSHFWNNCFDGSEKFLTEYGNKTFSDCEGQSVRVLSPIDGEFKSAVCKSYGEQEVYNYSFSNVRGNQQSVKQVLATENHRWLLHDNSVTTNLKVGDVVLPMRLELPDNPQAFLHGFVFGDGSGKVRKKGFSHQLRLCGGKSKYLEYILPYISSYSFPKFANGDPVCYIKSLINLKSLPDPTCDAHYIGMFLKGWIAADGHIGSSNRICTISKESIDFLIENAHYAGYVITSPIRSITTPSNFGERRELFYVSFQPSDTYSGFKVVSKDFVGVRKVFCVEEPDTTFFTLSGGMATGNCLLLKAEEDTREEWAALAQRATASLMSGAGIGIDYSILRHKGLLLSRTGGISSGPMSLMYMINEIGRNVMQGGSRRSAIYASLNWRHKDIYDFLASKDYSKILIAGTDRTVEDLKKADFNYKAPLDMTNISVNYDDAFLACKDLPDVFLMNVRNALMHGEPGFSFNFGDKQGETLRNACD